MRAARPILLAVLLAACTGPGFVDRVYIDTSYTPRDLNYVAGGGGNMRTDIRGNPFGGDQQAFEAAVTSAMEGAHAGPHMRFVTSPAEPAREPYRVRLVFNGTGDRNSLCGTLPPSAPPAVSPQGEVRVLAAFCRGPEAMTYLAASSSGIRDAADPKFRGFIRQVTFLLLPARNPENFNGSCVPELSC
jgi:hypothetical protein